MKTDYDHNANFAQYKTYSWEHVQTKDPLYVDRIKAAVNAALTARGWTQMDSGGDVSIIAIQTAREQETLNTFYDGFGGGWGWRRFGGGGFGDATTTTETRHHGFHRSCDPRHVRVSLPFAQSRRQGDDGESFI